MSSVLVTGAGGMIGPVVIRQLVAQGCSVIALCRTLPPPALFPSKVRIIQGDIGDAKLLKTTMRGVNVVYHLAARLHILSPGTEEHDNYWRVNVDGTRLVAEAAVANSVSRFIYFSTVKVYGKRQRQPIVETEPTNPQTIYAATKLAGEQIALSSPELATTVLRLSAVIGPDLKGSWAKLIQAVAKNRFLPIGHLENVHSLTYVEDVARAALLVAERSETAGQCLNLVGYESPTLREILNAIYHAHGHQMPIYAVPAFPAKVATHVSSRFARFLPVLSRISDTLSQLTTDEAYSGALLRQIGFTPSCSLAQAWTSTIMGQSNKT